MLDHGALTDAYLACVAAGIAARTSTEPLVGDGVAPADGGWLHGQPGEGVFRPYVVLASGGGAPRSLDVSTQVPLWAVGFSLRSFGGSRRQCDWMATIARDCSHAMNKVVFGESEPWKVINIEYQGLGPVVRVDATNPPFWSVYDSIVLVVGKS